MTDFDDNLLRNAFADYRSRTSPHVKPVGLDTISRGVRRLRRTRHTIIAVLVAVFALPVAAYAITLRSNGSPGPLATSGPSAAASPWHTASPVGSPYPPTPTPIPPVNPEAPVSPPPAGGFKYIELENATFTLPSWDDTAYPADVRCTSGSRTFINGWSEPGVGIRYLAYVDLDRDGQYETIVHLGCRRGGETGPDQIIVVGRGAGGTVKTYGQVVTTNNGIEQLGAFAGLSDGNVEVEVRDRGLCCSSPYTGTQHQWRTYSWTGQRFAQTAGATQFAPESAQPDLAVTVSDLVFGKPVNGVRTGSMTITVRNKSAVSLIDAVILVGTYGATNVTPDWAPQHLAGKLGIHLGGLGPNGMQTRTVTITTTETAPARVGAGALAIGVTVDRDYLRDTNPADNQGSDGSDGVPAVVKFS